jgi:hypothetical protein
MEWQTRVFRTNVNTHKASLFAHSNGSRSSLHRTTQYIRRRVFTLQFHTERTLILLRLHARQPLRDFSCARRLLVCARSDILM